MSTKQHFSDIGRKTGITNAAGLTTTPEYGAAATNPVLLATDNGRQSKAILLEVDLTGAGSGNVLVTIWRGNPILEVVSIASDEQVAGVWTTAYAGTPKRVSIIVDSMGLDLGITATVSAVNITANIHATAIF